MGFLNLEREEADVLYKRSERCIVLLPILIVFFCLLLSGGSRLIGHVNEEPLPSRTLSAVRMAFCNPPEPVSDAAAAKAREQRDMQRETKASVWAEQPYVSICRDSNGNVLGSMTYLHAVYQAFSLGDGFA